MEYMLMPLKRYADFSGRSRRKEYWMFALFQIIALTGLIIFLTAAGVFVSGGGEVGSLGAALLIILLALAFVVPNIAVQVRRLHDQDKSGWFLLLGLVPYVGGIIMLVFMCIEGTRGPNRFGEDPKDPTSASVFE